MTKKKKELYYPLAVRDCEFNYASNERQMLSNSSMHLVYYSLKLKELVDEMSRNYNQVPLKELHTAINDDLMDYQTFSETFTSLFYQYDLHKVLFDNPDFNNTFETLLQSLFSAQ